MYVEARRNKYGELISYRLICSGKDYYTGKHMNYTKTWKIPKNLTKSKVEHELDKVKYEFEEEVEKKSSGRFTEKKNSMFEEFANKWHGKILKRNEDSYCYHNDVEQHLKVIIPYFKGLKIRSIGPDKIQDFYDDISASTYDKQVVIVKKSIKELIEYKQQHKIAESIGINRLTLRMASNIGNQVSMATAKAVCKYFNVPIEKYFEITTTKCRYSKATIAGIRRTLKMIFAEAKRQQYVDENFTTKDYTKPFKVTTTAKTIYNQDEAKQFVKCIENESDLRRKASLAMFIFLGLRKGEVAGMTFNAIDFEANTLSVRQNRVYAGKNFGIKNKRPKTETSIRTISMPKKLAEILLEYKQWWLEQKTLHGDLWAKSNLLFLQDCGEGINPCTLAQWVTKFEIENDFKHVSCHGLRHTATTLMIKSGIPIKVVSYILGHSSPAFTLSVYTHLMEGQPEEASITYNDFLCG